jgi:hypothetical protein
MADFTLLSKELGGNDDVAFLKIIWRSSINNLEDILLKTTDELKWVKQMKGVAAKFQRRDLAIIKNRVSWVKEVIASKKKDPNFIPNYYK